MIESRDLEKGLKKNIDVLILPGAALPVTDAQDIRDTLEHQVDLIIDGGHCGIEPTTVLDMTGDVPVLRREGKGRDHGFG